MRTWTKEQIYLRPNRDFADDEIPEWCPVRFTDEFIAWLAKEEDDGGGWIPYGDTRIVLAPEDHRPVGLGEKVCPLCKNFEEVLVTMVGKITGQLMNFPAACICKKYRHFWAIWKQVPERFQSASLADEPMKRMTLTKERQGEILDQLRQAPHDSYYLFGPPGTGKTHFSFGLYREAVLQSVDAQFKSAPEQNLPVLNVWRFSAVALCAAHEAWQRRDTNDPNCPVPAPPINRKAIESMRVRGLRPCLFLDELDKIAMTPSKWAFLSDIINAVYEHNGQLVTTSNKNYEALAKKWDSADDAGMVVRRFGNDAGAHSLEFVENLGELKVEIDEDMDDPVVEDIVDGGVGSTDIGPLNNLAATATTAPSSSVKTESGGAVRAGAVVHEFGPKQKKKH